MCLREHYFLHCLRSFLLYNEIAQYPRSLHDYDISDAYWWLRVLYSVLSEGQTLVTLFLRCLSTGLLVSQKLATDQL
jgi:hypothetical protein